jgi:predicted CXXCH cytochrome family protein
MPVILARLKGRRHLRWKALAVLGVLLAALGGCASMDPETKHKMLTVFFTGVPPLEEMTSEGPAEEAEVDAIAGEVAAPQGADEAQVVAIADPSGLQPPAIAEAEDLGALWVHGPVGANRCDLCHVVAFSEGLRGSTPPQGPRQLRMPVEELCVSCHDQQSPERASARGLYMHAPAAQGECVFCHDPHAAPRRYQLKARNDFELCTQCHDEQTLRTMPTHQFVRSNCTRCHNPHFGETSQMLRADFDEQVENY